jgi:hypothetical protein
LRSRHAWRACSVAAALASTAAAQPAPAPEPPGAQPVSEADKAQAKALFEQGLALSKQGAWPAALAAFLKSRDLYATRGNTQNAAVALSRLGRYDEAHDMFDQLLRDFPALGDSDRALVEDELKRLRGLVGYVEIVSSAAGATVLIDGVRRGTIPLGPVRVSAGSHVVRVFRPGYTPFTARIDVAGAQTKTLDVALEKLARSGTLRVNEASAKPAEVYVDGARVGTTPWSGDLAPGHHWVVLQGAGSLGTAPAPAPVRADDTTVLNLSLDALDCTLLVQPEPVSAVVAIDGVTVGRGRYQGRLPCGARRVEVADDGFVATRESVTLEARSPHTLSVTLERDPSSKLWAGATGAGLFAGLDVGPIVGLGLNGQAERACGDGCSAQPLIGLAATARVGYRFLSGFGAGLGIGVVRAKSSVGDTSVRVRDDSTSGRPLLDATSDVDSALLGVLGTVEASYRKGDQWPWLARLGLGVFVGEVDQRRAGALAGDEAFGAVRAQIPARYALAAPELRIGPKLGDSWHLSFGVRALFMVALEQPRFPETTRARTPSRFVSFDEAPVAGSFVWALVPTLAIDFTL